MTTWAERAHRVRPILSKEMNHRIQFCSTLNSTGARAAMRNGLRPIGVCSVGRQNRTYAARGVEVRDVGRNPSSRGGFSDGVNRACPSARSCKGFNAKILMQSFPRTWKIRDVPAIRRRVIRPTSLNRTDCAARWGRPRGAPGGGAHQSTCFLAFPWTESEE